MFILDTGSKPEVNIEIKFNKTVNKIYTWHKSHNVKDLQKSNCFHHDAVQELRPASCIRALVPSKSGGGVVAEWLGWRGLLS